MRKRIGMVFSLIMLGTTAIAQQTTSDAKILTGLPSSSVTISDLYKQNVYDPAGSKIGEVKDVLLGPDGRAAALIIGVGGFLGIGEKDVAVAFDAVKRTTKDNKTYLTLDTTKDVLRSAPGFKYHHQKSAWVPDTSNK